MRIRIAAVGKARQSPECALFEHYLARLPWDVQLIEVQDSKATAEGQQEREGALLLDAVKDCERLIALDERGTQRSSRSFAELLARWRDEAIPSVGFLIGGADGHSKAVKQAAHTLLSLGDMTWPHLLVRALLAEQLYRAYTIHTRHPYHRD